MNINGWKDISEPALKLIGRLAKQFKLKLDVGWCRAVDDSLLKIWFEGELAQGVHKDSCGSLQDVNVWGCNKIISFMPRKVGFFDSVSDNLLIYFFLQKGAMAFGFGSH